MKPYVVSCDLEILWKNAGIVMPSEIINRFRATMQQALNEIFGKSELIPEEELKDGLTYLTSRCTMPVVSIDPVYAPSNLHIDLTRLVDDRLLDIGYGSRDGTPVNLNIIIDNLTNKLLERDIALVDDVVFSGSMMQRIADAFRKRGITVQRVYAGVAIGEGIHRLRCNGIEVVAVRSFDEVIDEVCERDFFPGAPMSGRSIINQPNTSVPYLLPFGNVEKWASIPKRYERRFSTHLLRATADVYDTLNMRVQDLPRCINGLSIFSSDIPVSEALRSIAKSL